MDSRDLEDRVACEVIHISGSLLVIDGINYWVDISRSHSRKADTVGDWSW